MRKWAKGRNNLQKRELKKTNKLMKVWSHLMLIRKTN